MNSEKKQTIFLVLIFILIIVLIITIVIFIKYKNLIIEDTLTYGMKSHDFQYCSCIDNSGQTWESYEGGFIKNKQSNLINSQEIMEGILDREPIEYK